MSMKREVDSLVRRLAMLERSFQSLKTEIDSRSGKMMDKEFEKMKSELVSLSKYAKTEQTSRARKLDKLSKEIDQIKNAAGSSVNIDEHVEKLTESTDKVLETVSNSHRITFSASLFAIAFIFIAGLSLYNKFRCWEKKHVL